MLPARVLFNLLHNAWQRLHTMPHWSVPAKRRSIVLQVIKHQKQSHQQGSGGGGIQTDSDEPSFSCEAYARHQQLDQQAL
jgi:hypothetical protein